MAKTLSMTLPDRVHAALANHAKRELELEPSDFLRQFLTTAALAPQGASLKLELPALTAAPDPAQPQLPLGGGMAAEGKRPD